MKRCELQIRISTNVYAVNTKHYSPQMESLLNSSKECKKAFSTLVLLKSYSSRSFPRQIFSRGRKHLMLQRMLITRNTDGNRDWGKE